MNLQIFLPNEKKLDISRQDMRHFDFCYKIWDTSDLEL